MSLIFLVSKAKQAQLTAGFPHLFEMWAAVLPAKYRQIHFVRPEVPNFLDQLLKLPGVDLIYIPDDTVFAGAILSEQKTPVTYGARRVWALVSAPPAAPQVVPAIHPAPAPDVVRLDWTRLDTYHCNNEDDQNEDQYLGGNLLDALNTGTLIRTYLDPSTAFNREEEEKALRSKQYPNCYEAKQLWLFLLPHFIELMRTRPEFLDVYRQGKSDLLPTIEDPTRRPISAALFRLISKEAGFERFTDSLATLAAYSAKELESLPDSDISGIIIPILEMVQRLRASSGSYTPAQKEQLRVFSDQSNRLDTLLSDVVIQRRLTELRRRKVPEAQMATDPILETFYLTLEFLPINQQEQLIERIQSASQRLASDKTDFGNSVADSLVPLLRG